jgi:uncharacterized DUF497 family protein
VGLEISSKVRSKLAVKHNVSEEEVLECFSNRDGKLLTDKREEHKTDPLSQWFIAETDKRRKLKVVFIFIPEEGRTIIKSCFSPNPAEIKLYEKLK